MISDRYSDATTVYQGMGRGLSENWVSKLNLLATNHLKPDLTVVLDCPVSQGLKRTKERGRSTLDRFEKEKKSFHEKIRRGYLKLALQEPKRVKIINGQRPPQIIHKDILKLVLKKL